METLGIQLQMNGSVIVQEDKTMKDMDLVEITKVAERQISSVSPCFPAPYNIR